MPNGHSARTTDRTARDTIAEAYGGPCLFWTSDIGPNIEAVSSTPTPLHALLNRCLIPGYGLTSACPLQSRLPHVVRGDFTDYVHLDTGPDFNPDEEEEGPGPASGKQRRQLVMRLRGSDTKIYPIYRFGREMYRY
jgi:hypothetical protein